VIIPYTTHTGTLTTKDGIRTAGWRWLMTPDALVRTGWKRPHWNDRSLAPYGLDNGAWGCYTKGKPFDVSAFERALASVGDGADWVVIPDIVAEGAKSLRFSLSWVERLKKYKPILLPVQDGMTVDEVRPYIDSQVGIFVGGSTEWKLSSLPAWGRLAKERGAWLHVARVNSQRRIRLCQDAGANSFDGTSPVLFPSTLDRLNNAVRQGHLWG